MEEEVVVEEVSLFDEGGKPVDLPQVAEEEAPVDEAPAFEVPDKFKDKSMEDVIQSYVNLEKEYGNKSNEVGELRKLTDQILLNQAQAQQAPQPQAVPDNDVGFADFVEDPASAVDKALQKNPRLQKLEQELEANAAELSRKALLQRHEDADAVVASPEFISWASEAPGRLRLLQDAHQNRDVDVAADLLDMYKTTRKVATENATEERDAIAKSDLTKAKVTKGGVPVSTKPVFRRSELIQLKISNPAKYQSMIDDIHDAYAEGRVK